MENIAKTPNSTLAASQEHDVNERVIPLIKFNQRTEKQHRKTPTRLTRSSNHKNKATCNSRTARYTTIDINDQFKFSPVLFSLDFSGSRLFFTLDTNELDTETH